MITVAINSLETTCNNKHIQIHKYIYASTIKLKLKKKKDLSSLYFICDFKNSSRKNYEQSNFNISQYPKAFLTEFRIKIEKISKTISENILIKIY